MKQEPRPESAEPEGLAEAELTGPPRWVKVFGAVALVVIVLFVILLLAGRGNHGPARHVPNRTPSPTPSSATSDSGAPDHQPPAGPHRP